MLLFIYIGIVLVYFGLLGLAIYMLIKGYICDNHACFPFIQAFLKKTDKAIVLHLLNKLCEESLWPFAYISSSIGMFLLIAIIPNLICMTNVIIIFLLFFIVFYCIISFLVFHYVIPIKDYIEKYINNNCK